MIFQQWIEPKGLTDNPSCIEIDQMRVGYSRIHALIETLAVEVYFKDTVKLTKIPCQIILRITASYRGYYVIVISRSSFWVILKVKKRITFNLRSLTHVPAFRSNFDVTSSCLHVRKGYTD